MKILVSVFYSRWEGLDLPHTPAVNISNPKARATTWDFQGLFIGETPAQRFVDKCLVAIDDDLKRRAIVYQGASVLKHETELSKYFHVKHGSGAVGIFRIVPVKLGVPWVEQGAFDPNHLEFLKQIGWVHK